MTKPGPNSGLALQMRAASLDSGWGTFPPHATEYGTYKIVTATFWPWRLVKSPSHLVTCYHFAWKRHVREPGELPGAWASHQGLTSSLALCSKLCCFLCSKLCSKVMSQRQDWTSAYSQVDVLGVRYTTVNFRAKKRPEFTQLESPNRLRQS